MDEYKNDVVLTSKQSPSELGYRASVHIICYCDYVSHDNICWGVGVGSFLGWGVVGWAE